MMVGAIVFIFVQCALLAFGDEWDQFNDPATWNPSYLYKLDKLPTKGQAKKIPWSDTYWPSFEGGIANRWQDTDNKSPGFNYTLYTLEELKSGNVDINLLSPAEKFDLFKARYDYPLLKSEWKRCSPKDATWEGICHGWTPAAVQYVEPNNVVMTNPDGLKIPFASSDVKALLSYFLAQFANDQEEVLFMSQRCNTDLDKNPEKADSDECADTNPATFHIIMTNMIGLGGMALAADVDRSIEVWNQPVAKYQYTLGKTRPPTNTSAPGTVKGQSVSLTMYYVKETYPMATAHDPLILNKKYNYVLDLDEDGNILGGSYDKSQKDRVDFMWSEEGPPFYGYFEPLDKVYKAAIGGGQTRGLRPRRPPVKFEDYHAKRVTNGLISLSSYESTTQRAWLVEGDDSRSIRLHFTSFNTRRFTDVVRVFEVENGNVGAPIAVLHGSSVPDDIVLRPGVSALVTFKVDVKAARRNRIPLAKDNGFEILVQ